MATYSIHAVELQSMVNDTTVAMPLYDLQGGTTGELSYGEYARLRIQFDKATGGNFQNGQRFIFNPALFVAAPFVTPLQLGRGWVIDIANYTGTGVFDISLRATNPLAQTTQRNAKLVATRISDTRLQIDLFFYAAQDLFSYISDVPRINSQTLLSAATGVPNLDNSTDSAYRRQVTYIEFLIYAADNNFQPVGIGDPYVRNPAAPAQKSCAYDIANRFVDNGIGAGNAWAGGSLTENNLLQFGNDIGAFKFSDFRRLPEPFLFDKLDDNFEVLSFDGEDAILGKDANNVISVTINRKAGFTPDKVVARIWRVDSLISAQPFVTEYNIRTAEIPASNATPYPNAIGGETVFSTPASWSASATQIAVSFSINGTQLVSGADYRVWIGLYDGAARKSSSHLSKPMRVATDGRAGVAPLSVVGNILTFEYQYPNSNDVELSLLQRFRAQIVLDGATYGGGVGVFLQQLWRIECQYVDGTRIVARSFYDFVAGATNTNPPMILQVAGTNYAFSAEFRVPFSAAPFPTNTECRWVVTFRTPNANGTFNFVSIPADQIIRRKPINLIEVNSITFLDYDAFQASSLVYIDTLCRDVEKYVIEVRTDSNPPNKNITAMLLFSTPTTDLIALEENGFMPTFLPRLTADGLENVPPNFAASTSAFFVLDISLLPSNAQNISIGVLLQEI